MKKVIALCSVAAVCVGAFTVWSLQSSAATDRAAIERKASLEQDFGRLQELGVELDDVRRQLSDLTPLAVKLDDPASSVEFHERFREINDRVARSYPELAPYITPFPSSKETFRQMMTNVIQGRQDLAKQQVAVGSELLDK